MKKIALALIVAVFVLALAGCTSGNDSQESYGNPVGATAADGTVSVEISGFTFTLPKGFSAVDVKAGAKATGPANEQVSIYVNETASSEQRMFESDAARDWLKLSVDQYGSSVAKSIGKTSYGDVIFQDINGVDFGVKSGVCEKDGTTLHVVVACGYHEKKTVTVIAVTPDESELAFDIAKSMK